MDTPADQMETDEQKVAVITGASSGIGHATAIEFAKLGYNVVLAARRETALKRVAEECQQYGIRPLIVVADVTDEKAVQNIATTALRTFGKIDVWTNNAGVYLVSKFGDAPMEDIKRLMDVNFYGYVYGSRAALTQFREQGYGTLINISSINATAPQPYISLYSASQAAIRAMDDSIRMELRIDGLQDRIHVCTVMPASIDTNLFQNSANYTGREIRALEPVYSASYAAKQIASLATRPRREIIIGPMGRMMRQQSVFMPRLYERLFSRFTERDLLSKTPAKTTKGNLHDPIQRNTGISGGWRNSRLRADQLNAGIGLGIAATLGLIGLSFAMAKKNKSQ